VCRGAHPRAGRSQGPGGAAPHRSALLRRRRPRPAPRMRQAMLSRPPRAACLSMCQAIRSRPAAACAQQQRPGLDSGMLEARLRQVPHAERAIVARSQQQRHSAARSRAPRLAARAGSRLEGGPRPSAPPPPARRGGLARGSRHVARARLSARAAGHQLHVGDPAAVQPRAHQRRQRGLRSVPARAALRTDVRGRRQVRVVGRQRAKLCLLHSTAPATNSLHQKVPGMTQRTPKAVRARCPPQHSRALHETYLLGWPPGHGRPALGRAAPRSPARPKRPRARPCRPPPAARTARPGCAGARPHASAARPRRAMTATGRQVLASLMQRAVGCHSGAWRTAPATQPLRCSRATWLIARIRYKLSSQLIPGARNQDCSLKR
jgi:hypothetical protein